jgi:hypothetical protein
LNKIVQDEIKLDDKMPNRELYRDIEINSVKSAYMWEEIEGKLCKILVKNRPNRKGESLVCK